MNATYTLRPANERGFSNHGWLKSRHSFSFSRYYDPEHMGYGTLRVINDDNVAPAMGFGTHGHENMEIVSYVVKGELEHKDSMGNGSVLTAGMVQRMTAGTGIQHSEFNGSKEEDVHFLQIWIEPERSGLEPGYEERLFSEAERRNALKLIVSPDGEAESLKIHQDATLYASLLEAGVTVSHQLSAGRKAWIQVIDGAVIVNGHELVTGDGLAVEAVETLDLTASSETELLLFNLA